MAGTALSAALTASPRSRQELKELLGRAAALGLEVVPLVQSFGHMEVSGPRPARPPGLRR